MGKFTFKIYALLALTFFSSFSPIHKDGFSLSCVNFISFYNNTTSTVAELEIMDSNGAYVDVYNISAGSMNNYGQFECNSSLMISVHLFSGHATGSLKLVDGGGNVLTCVSVTASTNSYFIPSVNYPCDGRLIVIYSTDPC